MQSFKYGLFAFLLFMVSGAYATAYFRCYSLPSQPVQAYEYASHDCGGLDSKNLVHAAGVKTATSKDPNAKKDILCVYAAACAAEDTPPVGEPAPIENADLLLQIRTGDLKLSTLVCKGTGSIKYGAMDTSSCPSPSQCQHDVFYNFSSTQLAPQFPKGVNADVQPQGKQ
jgi:hypothetical protein